MKQTKTKHKRTRQEIIQSLKDGFKKVSEEWNKAIDELEKFDPMKGMEFPDFQDQMKGFGMQSPDFSKQMKGFDIDGKVKI